MKKAIITESLTKKVEILVYCDLCHKLINETPDVWKHEEVTIKATSGTCYPEFDGRSTTSTDICLDCWEEKVQPALVELGCKFRDVPADSSLEERVDEIINHCAISKDLK